MKHFIEIQEWGGNGAITTINVEHIDYITDVKLGTLYLDNKPFEVLYFEIYFPNKRFLVGADYYEEVKNSLRD